ncbi:MAG: methionine--tRNA ligase [Lentisphaeria bacterium]|nr:methionine--tRNA ligase [Lentisphaeria bacterium]
MSKFYVTTPIYYVNDKPHIGHAYTTVLADVLARYNRAMGNDTFFLTGTDEHGQKVQTAAEKHGISPQQHCDDTVQRFQELWNTLGITNDRFIRTTQEEHKRVVAEVLQDLYDRGEIYRGNYTGWYCVGDERFFTEKDLVDGKCPECGREVTAITENNYFFRMSKYQDWLIDYIKTHPDFILPAFRANETLGFLKKPLEDLCISRPKSRLSWGIELPFDKDYVTYVWFDALLNYVSGVGYRTDDEKFKRWWPASCELIGKDILTTHTVYWPTMLKAIGLPLPKTVFAHGWWLADSKKSNAQNENKAAGNVVVTENGEVKQKMGKSNGNAVSPESLIAMTNVDAFRYFLMAEMSLGNDACFSEETFTTRYNSDLANDLGNLLSRVVKMTIRATGGAIPASGELNADDRELFAAVDNAIAAMGSCLESYKLDQGIASVLNAVRAGNRYLEKCAPWTLAKNGETERLNTVLATSATAIYKVAVLLAPVMPNKMGELVTALGGDAKNLPVITELGKVASISGWQMSDVPPLFPRLEVQKPAPAEKVEKKSAKAEKKAAPAPQLEVPGVITINDFQRTELRTAKVLKAEKVEGADKLLKLEIEVGSENRQIVSGIAPWYAPDDLIGKNIVIVANLQKAKIRGIESCGMLLAAKCGDTLALVMPDKDIPSGTLVG